MALLLSATNAGGRRPVLIALVIMVIDAHFFVGAMESASHVIGIPAGRISLLLAPLATKLPEKLNSMLWL